MSTVRIPTGDVELVADAYGDPADPPVLLLHGGGQTRHSRGRTAADIGSSGWYALTVDLRGDGDGGWSPDGIYGLTGPRGLPQPPGRSRPTVLGS
jgi:pimeloyl-ACP methyl ester carboxylesterase